MSSPSHCARPAVPPKPDKIIGSPPTPSAKQHQDPFELMKLSTVGTQVNMLRKAPSTSTSSSTGTRPVRSPSAEGRHQYQSHEESENEEAGKKSLTSPKPALPPKPKPISALTSPNKKSTPSPAPGAVNQQLSPSSNLTAQTSLISKLNSLTSTPTAATTQTSIASARINKFENWRNTNSDSAFKPNVNNNTTNTIAAPVARIDELDNISDLNSPSQIKIQSPPQSLRKPLAQTSAIVNKSPVNQATKPPPHRLLPRPTVPNPAVSPRNVNGPLSIFQFPPSAPTVNRPGFSAQQIQQRQTKSASLGRNVNFTSVSASVSSHFPVSKKSTTLSSRVAPLDLQLSAPASIHGLANNQNSKVRDPILRAKSPNSAPVVPARPISFTKPVSANIFSPKEVPLGSVPPPPPPRMRKAQRALSLTSPISQEIEPLSPTLQHHSSIQLSPGPDTNDNDEYFKPVYATVDKEKKWADRQRQHHQNSNSNTIHDGKRSLTIDGSVDEDEFGEIKASQNENENERDGSVIHSSLTISAKSWLGKFIDGENSKISTESGEATDDSEKESMVIQRPNQNKTKNKFTDNDKSNGGRGNGSAVSVSHPSSYTNNISLGTTTTTQCSTTLTTNTNNNNEEDNSSELVEAYNPHINVKCAQDSSSKFNYGSTNPFTSPSLNNHNQNKPSHTSLSEQQTTISSNSAATSVPTVNNNKDTAHFTIQSDSDTFTLKEKDQEDQAVITIMEKEPLSRNESFLFAMQDTNLKLMDSMDALTEEIDNTVASKEIKLSCSAAVTDTDNNSARNTHGSTTINNINNGPNFSSLYQHQHDLAAAIDATLHSHDEQVRLDSSTAYGNNSKTELDPTNSFLYATFSQAELITTSTPEVEAIDAESLNQDHPIDSTTAESPIPNQNRESVLDVFEKELENQLETLDYESQLLQSATFNTHEENTYYRNRYANNNSKSNGTDSANNIASISEDAHDTEGESDSGGNETENQSAQNFYNLVVKDKDTGSGKNKSVNEVNKNDPSKYLEFVDSRLQSMQHLLDDIKSPTQSGSGSINDFPPNHKPAKVSFSTETKETGGEDIFERGMETQRTDRDIVANIVLSSKRFDKNDQNQLQNASKGRRATAPELITSNDLAGPDGDLGSGPSSLNTVDKQQSLDIPAQDENFHRRSWNSSDYSPSPSESSSSSCSYGHSHPRRSCNECSSGRRKQVATSWIDEGELSTGALGDGESSDAPAPSSIEDIDHATQGGESNRVVKRKQGGFVSSIFGSFGKGGQSYRSQTRSQFFLSQESDISLVPDAEHLSSSNPKIMKAKDKTMSLPAVPARQRPPKSHKHWSTASEQESVEEIKNGHRPLRRSPVSSASASTLPLPQVFPIVESDSKTETEFEDRRLKSVSIIASSRPQNNDIAALLTTLGGGDSSDVESVHSAGGSSVGPYEDILADLSKCQRKSFYVAREILTSERTFVDVLNLLTLDFPLAMKMAGDTNRMPVISHKDMEFILGGLPGLKAVNEVLVSKLEERIRDWKENPKVADIIVKNGPFLKHYSTYVRDFERIVQKLDSCCAKNPAFAQAVKNFEGNVRCQKLGLRHYMLKPIQRMPQYRLLLEDYKKTLTEESEDYDDTVKAIAIVREVAEHANEAINLQINAEKLMHLQNRLPGIIVMKTSRFLLKEGELLKVCRKELQPRYFALMTDCLLCMTYNASAGTTNMKDLKLRYELPLTGMRISLPQSEDYLNEFSVISTSRSFNLVAKSTKERDEWMKKLQSAIQDNIKKRTCTTPDMEKERIGSEAPLWTPDKRVTMCQVCTAEFTVTFRRHHCRACGKVVCSNCSGNQAPLQYKNNEADRVCDDCFEYLLEEFDRENREKNTNEANELRARFKKHQFNAAGKGNKNRRSIPDKFKMQANNSDCRISGYLQWKERKAWKRHWFVLMDRVLYVYAASEDIVAMKTIPVLGYQVEPIEEETFAGLNGELLFKLTHTGQNPIFFQAESASSAEKWLTAIQEASVLT